MRLNFCDRGFACSSGLVSLTCLLLVLSLSTLIIAAPLGEIDDNVSELQKCPILTCRMNCPSGLEIDEAGCYKCECRNPCREFICPEGEICESITVNCFRAPCNPMLTCKKT